MTYSDWSRFDIYAPRVNSLLLYSDDKTIVEDMSLYRHSSQLFPSLTFLQWEDERRSISLDVFSSGPTLINLLLSPSLDNQREAEDTRIPLLPFLQSLVEIDLPLQRLSISLRELFPPLEKPLRIILHQSIRLVEVGVTLCTCTSVLQELAHLPSLRKLTLKQVRELQASDACNPLEDKSLFPVLESLSVEDAAFIHSVLPPHRSAGLRHFELNMEQDQDTQRMYQITLPAFRPLFSFRHLEIFIIEPGFCAFLTDSDIEEMVAAWPELAIFNLGTVFRSKKVAEKFEPQITFRSLDWLAGFPKLESIGITLSPKWEGLTSLLSPPKLSRSRVTTINLGPGGMESSTSCAEVALFLVQRFPALGSFPARGLIWPGKDDNGYHFDSAQNWYQVSKEFEAMRRIVCGNSRRDEGDGRQDRGCSSLA